MSSSAASVRAGFAPGTRTESVFLADVNALASPAAPITGLSVGRTLGSNRTRFAALLGGDSLGYLDVDNGIGDPGRIARQDGWADVGNLHVAETHRRRGIASWLLGQAAEWLWLGHVDRLLDYATAGLCRVPAARRVP